MTSVDDTQFSRLLVQSGLAHRDSDIAPIAISPRQLVGIAVRSMHSMWQVFEWEAPYFWGLSGGAWWRVDGDRGMVLFGLGTEMTMCDYAAVRHHDSSILDDRGTDGDYTIRHVGNSGRLYFIPDSDEFYSVALDASSYNARALRRQPFGEFGKGSVFRALCTDKTGITWNRLQKTKLFAPTRIHSEPIAQEKWQAAETQALRKLLTWVDPPGPLAPFGAGLPAALTRYASLDDQISVLRVRHRLQRMIWRACSFGPALFRLPRWSAEQKLCCADSHSPYAAILQHCAGGHGLSESGSPDISGRRSANLAPTYESPNGLRRYG